MQLVMPFAPSHSYEAGDYLRGAANAEALALVEHWPNWPYSIVLIHGESGSGKTHLAHVFAARAHASFLDGSRIGHIPADHLLAGNHAWILDGIESLREEAALAQMINHARARGDYLLMTATKPAPALDFTLPDLRSRLNALPSVSLAAPDDALLMGVLAKQFADRQLRVSSDVLTLAVRSIERSYSAARSFVQAMDKLSLARGRALTPALLREALKHADHES
jgi:chromosomal replication initiation ATPase DnaA